MHVTAEGVETAKQVAFLDQATADRVQGFFFGRPIPACDVAAGILADFQQTTVQPPPLLEAKEKLQLAK
jgi:EAL domain-containing protein (putative c-di-GMP-specific phosphodiesterase class I)